MKRLTSLLFIAVLLGGVLFTFTPAPQPAQAVSPNIVISQVYGGGGNSGATYTHDFIELFNLGNTPVSVIGWSVQYASATGTSWNTTPITGTIQVGQYFLIQLASNAAVGAPLPTPDTTGTINMGGTSGKVALVSSTTALTGSCPVTAGDPTVVDFIGYGSTNCAEGTSTAVLSSTTAAIRKSGGCTETDSNASDFDIAAPTPRNTASPLNVCGADSAPSVASTSPVDGAYRVPVDANITVTFSEPVDVTANWFTLSCSISGAVAAATSGGPTTFTIDPVSDFDADETCTLTVLASQVSDQDTDDPPDFMADNASFSFSTTDPCTLPFTATYSIQGSGLTAAITGTVTTQGVVVGDFETTSPGLGGFYLQDLTGDGNAATSDGIFVYTGSANLVSAGEVVRVTGYARERFNLTAINGANDNNAAVPPVNIISCGTGSVPPVDVMMPFPSDTYLERYEGMLVRLPQALTISEFFNYDRYGEIVLALPLDGETRAFTPTAVEQPGAPALARAEANALSRIILDDGLSTQNPSSVRHPNGEAFSLDNRFRGGDLVQNTVGVLSYEFSQYRIQPTAPADYTPANPRPEVPEVIGTDLRVAAMNTLNFFLTLDYPTGNPQDNKCGPALNMECRGADADQPLEFERQRTKLLAALASLNADVIGLNEIENTTGVDPLGDPDDGIVAGLNALITPGAFAAIDTGTIGTDAIKVGLIYRPAVVTPVGNYAILDSSVDSRFLDTKNRPSLAQTFEVNSTGERFTVVVNHFKSKSSDCNDVGDPDTGDGQGNCNITRTAAAQALVDWLATDPTNSGDPDFLIIGDLNSYAMEDPIKAILAGPDDILGTGDDYTNLIQKYMGPYAYSYTFDGQVGYLDYALASASLLPQVISATEWHINADEPDILDYDTSFKPAAQDALYEPNAYRSSDHDPLFVGLMLEQPVVEPEPDRLFLPLLFRAAP